jgi:hypothetical protein
VTSRGHQRTESTPMTADAMRRLLSTGLASLAEALMAVAVLVEWRPLDERNQERKPQPP